MPEIATGDNSCQVSSPDGSGDECNSPMMTSTNECSSKVFVGGIGVVRQNDKVAPHPKSGCGPDTSGLTTFSSKVFVEGRGVGRKGDMYGDNTITTGSSKVTCG